jgi:hypothetical protein
MDHRRRIAVGGAAALLVLATAVHHPTPELRILTHDPADSAPRRIAAAVDLGFVGVSVLVTWTARNLAR